MFEHLPADVVLFEVGPRDGLAERDPPVTTTDKVALIDALSAAACALSRSRASSTRSGFRSWPTRVRISATGGASPWIIYSALVPIRRDWSRRRRRRCQRFAVFRRRPRATIART